MIAQEIAIILAQSYYGVLKKEMEEIAIHLVQSYYGILQNVMEMNLNNWSIKLLLKHSAFYRE